MCGIAGFFNCVNAVSRTVAALKEIRHRGIDGSGLVQGKRTGSSPEAGHCLGHVLHSVVGSVKQPLEGKGVFAANCEIYNWRSLSKKYSVKAGNDAEAIFRILEKEGFSPDFLKELDGVWAFAYWRGGKVFLCRDILGVKPLWFSLDEGLCFASERKALWKAGCSNAVELDPRKVLEYDLEKGKARFLTRSFFSTAQKDFSEDEAKERLLSALEGAVKKRVPRKRFGLLFSGGIDSVVLAALFRKMGLDFTCFFSHVRGIGRPKDLAFARKAARSLKLDLEIISVPLRDVNGLVRETVPLIESSNPVKVGVALPFLTASEAAGRKGLKVLFSGLGADELFCGYARFRNSNSLSLDSKDLLLQMHENDLYRDDVTTMRHSVELRLPFLDPEVVRLALSMPPALKISGQRNKVILRELAASLGISREFAERGKTAAQYGSNFDKAIERLARSAGKRKAEFLSGFASSRNLGLAALFSGGKDSCLALWIMQRQNYGVKCLVALLPENEDSFMYHKPSPKILELQSEALGIPLVLKRTAGEKERELRELKAALKEAIQKFEVQGVVSGALYSNYQRERIQRICNELGLRLFSPLWHKGQLDEMLELVNSGFSFIFTKVAALGLGEEWLGRPITHADVIALQALNKKHGFNVAGEGGEFESLVLDAPNFKKRITVSKAEKVMENEFTGLLKIGKASLEPKQLNSGRTRNDIP